MIYFLEEGGPHRYAMLVSRLLVGITNGFLQQSSKMTRHIKVGLLNKTNTKLFLFQKYLHRHTIRAVITTRFLAIPDSYNVPGRYYSALGYKYDTQY